MSNNLQTQIIKLIQNGKTEQFLDEHYTDGNPFHGCFVAEIKGTEVKITNVLPKNSIPDDANKVDANFRENESDVSNQKLIQGAKKLGYTTPKSITGFFTANIQIGKIEVTEIYLGKCDKSAEEHTLFIDKALNRATVLRTNANDLRKPNTLTKIMAAFIEYKKYFQSALETYDKVSKIEFVKNQILDMNKKKIIDMYTKIYKDNEQIEKDWSNNIRDNIQQYKQILTKCAGLLEKFATLLENYKYVDVQKPEKKPVEKGGRKTRKLRPRNRSDKSRSS